MITTGQNAAFTSSENDLLKQNFTEFKDDSCIRSETDSLLPKQTDRDQGDDKTYQRYRRLDVEVTWSNWLIGPIVFVTIFGMVSSGYTQTEYTKHYFKVREFDKANLSLAVNDNISRCNEDPDNAYYQAETRATSEASNWNSYYSLAGGLPSILANLVLGAYSDAFGRKFLLIASILGASVRLAITAVVIYLEQDLYFIIIACFIEGCTGQHATLIQMALAYVADITESGRKRIFGIIYIEGALGIGLALGSFATGYIVDALGYENSMIISAGALAANLFFSIFALPETLSKRHRKHDRSIANKLKNCFKFFVEDDSTKKRWKFRIVILIHILCEMSYVARLNTETLYQLSTPFCWSPTKVGIYAAVRTLVIMSLGLGSIKALQPCMDEVTICIFGTISYGACFYWTAFASNDLTLYLIIVVGAFGALATTMHRSILSHMTPPESQGAIFTAVGTIDVAFFMIANVSTASIYAATVSYMRGFVFLVLGSYSALSLLLLVALKIGWYFERRRGKDRDHRDYEISFNEDSNGQ